MLPVPPQNVQALSAVVYVSAASGPVSEAEIESLLEVSRRNNSRLDITGMLLFCNGSYMQYLEGPSAAVAATFGKVQGDPRHHRVTEMYHDAIDGREFADWSMAYSVVNTTLFNDLRQASWARAPGQVQSVGKQLLLLFWQSNTLKSAALRSLHRP